MQKRRAMRPACGAPRARPLSVRFSAPSDLSFTRINTLKNLSPGGNLLASRHSTSRRASDTHTCSCNARGAPAVPFAAFFKNVAQSTHDSVSPFRRTQRLTSNDNIKGDLRRPPRAPELGSQNSHCTDARMGVSPPSRPESRRWRRWSTAWTWARLASAARHDGGARTRAATSSAAR